MSQRKIHYGDIRIFHGQFIAPKINFCPTKIENGRLEEKKTFKSFQAEDRLLEPKQYFDLLDGDTICRIFPIIWKRSCDGGIEIPSKVRNCEYCLKSETKTCEICEKKNYQHKELKASLNELKIKTHNAETKNRLTLHYYFFLNSTSVFVIFTTFCYAQNFTGQLSFLLFQAFLSENTW